MPVVDASAAVIALRTLRFTTSIITRWEGSDFPDVEVLCIPCHKFADEERRRKRQGLPPHTYSGWPDLFDHLDADSFQPSYEDFPEAVNQGEHNEIE
jgi:hypothetical protein